MFGAEIIDELALCGLDVGSYAEASRGVQLEIMRSDDQARLLEADGFSYTVVLRLQAALSTSLLMQSGTKQS